MDVMNNLQQELEVSQEELKLVFNYLDMSFSDKGIPIHIPDRTKVSWDFVMFAAELISRHVYDEQLEVGSDGDLKVIRNTAFFRTFGMQTAEGDFMVRFNRAPLFSAPTLIRATFDAVVDWIRSYNSDVWAPTKKFLEIGCEYDLYDLNISQMRAMLQLLQVAAEAKYTHVVSFDESESTATAIADVYKSLFRQLDERIKKRTEVISKWSAENPGFLVTEMPEDLLKDLD